MKAVGVIQLVVLAMAVFAVFVAIVSATVYPHLRQRLMRAEPARRTRALLALSVLPAVAAVGLTALCFLPSTLGTLWPDFDHCPHHGNEHPHFCLVHLPLSSGSLFAWLVAAVVATYPLLRALHRFTSIARSRRAFRQIVHSAVFDRARGIWLVEADFPLAVTTGVLRPRIFMSTALLRSLPPDLVDAVTEHERAHRRRRDVLLKLVAGILSLVHLRRTRLRLLADLDLAAEQACDEETGVLLGDRLRVARALLALERLLQGTGMRVGLAGVSFGSSSVIPRVESLLGAPGSPVPHNKARRWLVAVAAAALLLLADPLHHSTETILGLLAR